MASQRLLRPGTNGGDYPIDIQEMPDGTGYSYRPTHYGTRHAHEVFATPDAAADAAAAIWDRLVEAESQPVAHDRYLELCERWGVAPKDQFAGWEDQGNYSVYEHGEKAVEMRLHQLRYVEIKRERAAQGTPEAQTAAVRSLETYLRNEEEDAARDRYI